MGKKKNERSPKLSVTKLPYFKGPLWGLIGISLFGLKNLKIKPKVFLNFPLCPPPFCYINIEKLSNGEGSLQTNFPPTKALYGIDKTCNLQKQSDSKFQISQKPFKKNSLKKKNKIKFLHLWIGSECWAGNPLLIKILAKPIKCALM